MRLSVNAFGPSIDMLTCQNGVYMRQQRMCVYNNEKSISQKACHSTEMKSHTTSDYNGLLEMT